MSNSAMRDKVKAQQLILELNENSVMKGRVKAQHLKLQHDEQQRDEWHNI